MPMSKTKRLKMQAQRKGYKQGMKMKLLSIEELDAQVSGEEQGERSMNNEQIDNVSENSDNLTIVGKAVRAWQKWADDNNVSATNTQPETFKLMSEAFIDGYLNGFTKRFTEGA